MRHILKIIPLLNVKQNGTPVTYRLKVQLIWHAKSGHMVVYHILLVSFFFFSIDRFDLICLIIRLQFYSDEFLHFTYGFEFNLYTKDMKK